jgi:predicted nuclease of restriction endonuclease-like (RecB) superfamily
MSTKKSAKPRARGRKVTALALREPPPRIAPKVPTSPKLRMPAGYARLLADIKGRIRHAQLRASLAANRELTKLYWHIGQTIVERQRKEGWGKAVVERLSRDLQAEFPGVNGFSPTNIWRMRAFYLAWREAAESGPASKRSILPQAVGELDDADPGGESGTEFLPQLVGEIPWGHNAVLLEKLSSTPERIWYARQTIAHGWSRAVLTHQIESRLHHRQGKATTTLPPAQSDLAQQTLKDPYTFDFLTLAHDADERELEREVRRNFPLNAKAQRRKEDFNEELPLRASDGWLL